MKIPNADLDAVRRRLASDASAQQVSPPNLEFNTLFDTTVGLLQSRHHALRLRRVADRWLLTFKGAPRYQGVIKVREELETEIADGEIFKRTLDRIGFKPCVSYEKIRETWRVDDIVVTLDHTPIGDFVELEGPAEALGGVAVRLGLDPETGVRDSYLALWREYRLQHPELALPPDMRFDE